MNNQTPDVRDALSDIALIRQVLDRVEDDRGETNLFGISLDANVLLQVCAFGGVLICLFIELFSGNSISELVAIGGDLTDMHQMWIAMIGLCLFGLLVVFYFVLWRAASHSNEDMTTYIARNFRYAWNLSFVSDLLLKFFAMSLLILAGQAAWVAPLLLAFTGDFLLQGRFFTLPSKMSQILGVLCFAGAGVQFFYFPGVFSIPLVVFAVICGASLIRLVMRYRTVAG